MKIRLIGKQLIPALIMLVVLCISSSGCFSGEEHLLNSSADKFAALVVPDAELELYIYTKQEGSTIIPAKIVNTPYDIKVESAALWGLPSDNGLILGAVITFANTIAAAEIYSRMVLEENIWKNLRDNKIYIVEGSNSAAESLKSAILDNRFKYYTNGDVLKTVAMMPRIGKTKIVAMGLAKPSEQVLRFAAGRIGKDFDQVSNILRLVNAEVIIGGLYSPHQINVAKAIEVFEQGDNIASLDLGILVLIKSKLPGFVAEPIAKNLLVEYGFSEGKVDEFTIYKGGWSVSGRDIPILIRVEDNYIFLAISGQEAYANTLIKSIYK